MTLSRRRIVTHGLAAAGAAALFSRVAEAAVWNDAELRHALANLAPGARIRLMPGAFGGGGPFVAGTPGLVLDAEDGALVAEEMVVLAGGLTVTGQNFTTPLNLLGPGAVVTGCSFTGHGLYIDAHATGAAISGCTFRDALTGVSIIRVGVSQTTANTNVGAKITNCTFKDLANGHQESVCLKASGNTVAGNVLANCNNITSRCGSNNVISNNTTSAGYGIVIQDNDNHVIGNKVLSPKKGKGIFIMAGDAPYTSNVQGVHAQAYNTEVGGNTGPLMVGKQYGAAYSHPALNTRISAHTGPISLRLQQGTTQT